MRNLNRGMGIVAAVGLLVGTLGVPTSAVANEPPDCSAAAPVLGELWPPNHDFRQMSIEGVTDPDGDPIAITITEVSQDERLDDPGSGNTCPDAAGVGTDTALLRGERNGGGDGRVYHVSFRAEDGQGGECNGTVAVCHPHDQGQGEECVDGGPLFDSTGPCDAGNGTLPPLADVCTHPETVLSHLHSLVSGGLIRNSSRGNESVCEQACRMLGISCFVLASNALSCQSLGVTFASLVGTTLCRANSDFSEFIACFQFVSQVASEQRPGIQQILGTRSECQEVAAHCSDTCSGFCGDGFCDPSEEGSGTCPPDCGTGA
jgi:hypothetical protein